MARIFTTFLICFFGVAVLPACGSFMASDQKAAALQLELGTSQLQEGAYPQALSTLLKAESLDPSNPVIENNLGLAYYVRDHFTEAEKHIRKAIDLDAKYTDAHNNLGRTLIELTRYREAINELNIATKDLTYISPDKPLLNLGIAYFRLNRFSDSEYYFVKSLDLSRENCLAHDYLGRAYYEQKKYSQASTQLDRAAAFCLKSQFDEPVYYAAISYYQQGHPDLATGRLNELLKLYPNGKYREKAKTLLEDIRR